VSFQAYTSDFVEPNERISSTLRIRSAPNSSADIVGSLSPGQQLPLLSKDISYYYEVEQSNGQPGYVSKGYSRVVTQSAPTNTELKIAFIDVGQGDSTLITCPNNQQILIDAGSLSSVGADVIRNQILPELDQNDTRIHTLIITHPDTDHYNKLKDAIGDIPVDKAFWVGTKEDYNKTFWKWFNTDLKASRTRLEFDDFNLPTSPNTNIDCGEAEVFILAADVTANKSVKNATSIVVMIRYNSFEAIFTGDATHATENVILDRYDNSWLDIDLLKIGHHGSLSTSTSKNWADTLSPEVAIVSAGYENQHGHPRQEVIQRLEPHTSSAGAHSFVSATGKRGNYTWHHSDQYMEAIYSTVTNGKILVTTDGNSWQVTSEE
jgi:competence protein ComEC